jgi:hypothetical protein
VLCLAGRMRVRRANWVAHKRLALKQRPCQSVKFAAVQGCITARKLLGVKQLRKNARPKGEHRRGGRACNSYTPSGHVTRVAFGPSSHNRCDRMVDVASLLSSGGGRKMESRFWRQQGLPGFAALTWAEVIVQCPGASCRPARMRYDAVRAGIPPRVSAIGPDNPISLSNE